MVKGEKHYATNWMSHNYLPYLPLNSQPFFFPDQVPTPVA